MTREETIEEIKQRARKDFSLGYNCAECITEMGPGSSGSLQRPVKTSPDKRALKTHCLTKVRHTILYSSCWKTSFARRTADIAVGHPE